MTFMLRSSSVPLQRRWISDIVHFGRTSHSVGGHWIINVAAAAAARKSRNPPISWVAIWVRAMALAAQAWPELRTCYLPYPWPRLYRHPFTVATLVVERQWNGGPSVFFETVKNPETLSLAEIELTFRAIRELPVESVGAFRQLIRMSKWPLILRRIQWSIPFYWSGRLRTKYMGSFAVNFIRAPRFKMIHITPPISFALWFGLVEPNGDMSVQMFWDHRIADGMVADRMVREFENILNTEIAAELQAI